MKKLAILLACLAMFSGCQTKTSAGPCIGVTDDKVPGVKYKVSARNVILGILFIETVVVPVVVVFDEIQCPVETGEEK